MEECNLAETDAIKCQFLTIQNNKNISHYDVIWHQPSWFFLTNNNQSMNLCEKGLSIILFFCGQTKNYMKEKVKT